MRTAVLISGEYRSFDICRPTMTFLDDEGTDVYVSTWDSTHYKSPKIELDTIKNVSIDEISRILNRPAEILVESTEIQRKLPIHYNCNMIHRWKQGIQMILDSGIEYDYVIVTRFDLYFDPLFDIKILEILQDGGYSDDVLRSTWTTESKSGDLFMIAPYKKMIELMTSLTIKKWCRGPEGDWHIWFNLFSKSIFTNVVNINIIGHTICRYFSKCGDDFPTVCKHHYDWRDLTMLYQSEAFGRNFSVINWSEEIVSEAERKWAEGYYDKYKNYGKDNL